MIIEGTVFPTKINIFTTKGSFKFLPGLWYILLWSYSVLQSTQTLPLWPHNPNWVPKRLPKNYINLQQKQEAAAEAKTIPKKIHWKILILIFRGKGPLQKYTSNKIVQVILSEKLPLTHQFITHSITCLKPHTHTLT